MASAKDALSAMRFVNEFEDKKCSCEYCFKAFDNVSVFFRHVSHAKLCLNHYGQEFVETMRSYLRNNSKRKWLDANKDKIQQKPKKSCYVPMSKRLTDQGRMFESMFRSIYNEFVEDVRDQIEDFYEDRSKFVTEEDIDKALDKTFDFTENSLFGYKTDVLDEQNTEEEKLNVFFVELEKKFEKNALLIANTEENYWKKKSNLNTIGKELWTFSSNKAFFLLYKEEEFKELYNNKEDEVLDHLFLNLITTEHYFNEGLKAPSDLYVERTLERTFFALMEKEVLKTLEERGLSSRLRSLMEEIMKKRVYNDSRLKFIVPKFK